MLDTSNTRDYETIENAFFLGASAMMIEMKKAYETGNMEILEEIEESLQERLVDLNNKPKINVH